MKQLKAMEREYEAIIEDIQQHPERIKDYDLFGMVKEIEERNLNDYIEKEIELFDEKICEISSTFCAYKEQETRLLNQINDKQVKYDLEECIINKEVIYSKHLYVQGFCSGIELNKKRQV